MNKIAISETLVTRIGNSFSQEREFFLAGNEVQGSLEIMFHCKSYENSRNYRTH